MYFETLNYEGVYEIGLAIVWIFVNVVTLFVGASNMLKNIFGY